MSCIELKGVRTHNLRGVDLDIPKDALVVISGPSGSGKSSLAIDTIFAEGQRRFIESQSVAAQHWLHKVEAAPCESIRGLTPTIALMAKRVSGYARTTVGTLSEVYDHLRLLYARCGEGPTDDSQPATSTVQELVAKIQGLPEKSKYALVAPIFVEHEQVKPTLESVLGQGFTRITLNEELFDPASISTYTPDPKAPAPTIEVYVDRLIAKPSLAASRIADSVELAVKLGQGRVRVRVMSPEAHSFDVRCGEGGDIQLERSPTLFSFNTPLGACEACEGRGWVKDDEAPCSACEQTRLNSEARAVKIACYDLGALSLLPLHDLAAVLEKLSFADPIRQAIADTILPRIAERLTCMQELGLGYLSLHRGVDTLSGGEIQRLRLARQIGSELVGVTYVLDEPSIGLHPQDRPALIAKLKALRDAGNTVIVVEHDESIVRAADYLIDLGPGAGKLGGQVMAQGAPGEVAKDPQAASAALLRKELRVPASVREAKSAPQWIELFGASGNNLKNVDLKIPVGHLSCVSGVSGSGKSSLITKTLMPLALAQTMGSKTRALPYKRIKGLEVIKRVIAINDAPIKAGPRSNPATYTGIFAEIRNLFAALPASKLRGFRSNRFSFNAKGGRCESCQGEGRQKIAMQWMADLEVVCPVCQGSRYNQEILEIRYRGQSIAQVLETRVDQACELFVRHKKLMGKLELLRDVGLGYLELGQSLSTLSRGELARLKLAKDLGRSATEPTLYLLDEPSTGLHETDIAKLLEVLGRLVEAGHTVLIVEHHLSMIAAADWLIDLGPGPGQAGGQITAQGPPVTLTQDPASSTGPFLADYWKS